MNLPMSSLVMFYHNDQLTEKNTVARTELKHEPHQISILVL